MGKIELNSSIGNYGHPCTLVPIKTNFVFHFCFKVGEGKGRNPKGQHRNPNLLLLYKGAAGTTSFPHLVSFSFHSPKLSLILGFSIYHLQHRIIMSTTPKMIVLKSSDNETFEVEEAVAVESQTIKHMIEDDCADTCIPLPNVTSKILAKVIEYCKKHVDTPKSDDKTSEDELKNFDAEFVKVDQGTLFDLILV